MLLCCISFGAYADGGVCSKTTGALYRACIYSAADDLSVATANCVNGPDSVQCLRDAQTARREALARDRGYVLSVLQKGTASALHETQATLDEIRDALGLFRLAAEVD